MSITLTPDQQRVIEEAISAGLVASVDEFIKTAVKALSHPEASFDEPADEGSATAPAEAATGMVEENGLLVYRTGRSLPVHVVDEAIRCSREERSLHLLSM